MAKNRPEQPRQPAPQTDAKPEPSACANCQCFRPLAEQKDDEKPEGQCRRGLVMILVAVGPRTDWPILRADEWCAEHRPKV